MKTYFFTFRYQVVFLILTYVIPILLMSICYTVMGRKLWGAKSIGETTQRQLDSIRSKRKVIFYLQFSRHSFMLLQHVSNQFVQFTTI